MERNKKTKSDNGENRLAKSIIFLLMSTNIKPFRFLTGKTGHLIILAACLDSDFMDPFLKPKYDTSTKIKYP